MNILYISNLSTNIAAGLNWSVPATVEAQSKIDNVFWLNLSNVEMPHWKKIKAFHNINEYGDKLTIENLPSPFNHPDVVVFEGFYHPKDPKLAKELIKKSIPYIVTPRGSLTHQAQKLGGLKKQLKKLVANQLIFKPYTKHALAIQYLTQAEQSDSTDKWNKHSFVVPNGFNIPTKAKDKFSDIGLKAVFIGRLDLYHKGLDVLLQACIDSQEYLRENKFTLSIYGPKRYDYQQIKSIIETNKIDDFVFLKGEISGQEKENVLLDSDLFVLTSRFEGHPMGLVEAVAYGLPVLVTPGSNMADEIKEYDAGWVCETDAVSIGNSLKKIIENQNSFFKTSKNSLSLAKIYNWDNIALSFQHYVEENLKMK